MFWLLSHKHYLVLSLLIQKCINRHYDYDIFNRQINKHLEVGHKVIGIKRCHHGTCMSVQSSNSKFGSRIAGPSKAVIL